MLPVTQPKNHCRWDFQQGCTFFFGVFFLPLLHHNTRSACKVSKNCENGAVFYCILRPASKLQRKSNNNNSSKRKTQQLLISAQERTPSWVNICGGTYLFSEDRKTWCCFSCSQYMTAPACMIEFLQLVLSGMERLVSANFMKVTQSRQAFSRQILHDKVHKA